MSFTDQELKMLLAALNSAPFQGFETMQAILALANKLQSFLNHPKDQ